MKQKGTRLLLSFLIVVLFPASCLWAEGEYLIPPELFLEQVFGETTPAPSMVWLSGEKKEIATTILGHNPNFLRLRYWENAGRTAWIVDEIGKTEPITFGVVVANDEIESVQVLAFRESRGWEIKHDFFTRQFNGASLTRGDKLDVDIDGISGATLSVRAIKNVSRLVLYLSQTLVES